MARDGRGAGVHPRAPAVGERPLDGGAAAARTTSRSSTRSPSLVRLRGRRARRGALLPRDAAQRRGADHGLHAARAARGRARARRARARRLRPHPPPVRPARPAGSGWSTPGASAARTSREPGAYWLTLLGQSPRDAEGRSPGPLRRTEYDVEAATAAFAALGYPTARGDARARRRRRASPAGTRRRRTRRSTTRRSPERGAGGALDRGAVAPAEEHGVDEQRQQLEERHARLVAVGERCDLLVGGEEPRRRARRRGAASRGRPRGGRRARPGR